MSSTEPEQPSIPDNFAPTVRDFLADLSSTFPEYAHGWAKWLDPANTVELFSYISKVYPERFFDILYQNDDIFKEDSETDTHFLPGVDFRALFRCDGVSAKTKEAIWKYLQLILMTILKSVKDKVRFGDTANLFDNVNEADLQDKLKDTLEGISDFFKGLGSEESPDSAGDMFKTAEQQFNDFASGSSIPGSSVPGSSIPGAEEIHDHLKGLFDGKIGSLAKELAEEISKDVEHLFDDGKTSDIKSTQDLLKKMMRDPKKMMDLMKTIGSKIQDKMKTGDISEEEIMKEATELMGKMKGMGGSNGQFAEMMKNLAKTMGAGGAMGAGGMGKGAKFNVNAFQKMERQVATKERMQSKLEAKKLASTNDPTRKVFQMDDSAEQGHSAAPPALNDADLEKLFEKRDAPKKKKKSKK